MPNFLLFLLTFFSLPTLLAQSAKNTFYRVDYITTTDGALDNTQAQALQRIESINLRRQQQTLDQDMGVAVFAGVGVRGFGGS